MNSGMALRATHVVMEDGKDRPGFSKAVKLNSIPGWSNDVKGRIVSTEM